MEFRVLGPLEVRTGEREVACNGAKQRLLLSVLLLNANEVVSSDRLVDVLWGDHPPATNKALQMHVSQLRRALDPGVLVTRAPGYQLRVDEGDIDLHRFEAAVEEGRAALTEGRPADARRSLHDALALWRGPPLADLTFEECLQGDIARLEELRLVALEARIDADLALGNHADVIPELERLTTAHPTREGLRAQLMVALYRSGRQAEALEVYRDTRATLVEELGIEPGRELQEIETRILAQDTSLDLAPEETEMLIGREHELAQLLPLVDAALAGRGAVVLIAGEPGIGKSRLAETLANRAQGRGARVLVGRCWEAGGAPAYWPWVQALRGYTGAPATELTALFPDLAGLTEEDGARFRLFDAVGALIQRATEEAPVAIFLDDLHAADSPSLLLLRFVSAQLAGSRALISCCYRDTEVGPDLAEALADVGREAVAHRVSLVGLDGAATARLLADTMGTRPADALVARVQEETHGNPLFVAELGRLLDAAEPSDGQLPIPDGVRETISRRLGRCSDGCRDVLEVASVFGREFELDPLARVCGMGEDELVAALDEAARARFLDGRRFSHVLMRDALYDGLPGARRMALHREIAAVLEQRRAAASEIANHYLQGGSGVAEQAIAYATRAGDDAAAQHAYEEAVRHYESALRLLETTAPDDAERTCDLLLALGDVLSRAGDTDAAKQPFRRAATIAEEQRWADRLARAVLGYGGRFAWGRAGADPALVPLLERTLAVIGDEDSPARVRILARLATARRDDPTDEVRVALASDALAMARRIGDPGTLAYALEAKWTATQSPLTLEGRMELADEQIALSIASGNMELCYGGHDNRLNTFFTLADRAGIDVEVAAIRELADAMHQPAQRWHAATVETMLAVMEGRFEDAGELLERGRSLGAAAMRWNAEVAYRVGLLLLRRAQGRLAEVERMIDRSVHEYPALPRFVCASAYVHAEIGHRRRAREALDRLLSQDLEHSHIDEDWIIGVAMLPDVCARLGDGHAARRIYSLLLPFDGLYAEAPGEGSFGAISRGLGVLARALGELDQATRHFEDAVETERAMRARPWVAHAQHGLGEVLLARGDEARARAILAEAVAGYRELGMDSWAESAAAL
jgi:DNA-binding SARP family transcriptional activator